MRQPDQLPQPVLTRFHYFLEHHPPQEFSNNLRRLLLDHLRRQIRTGFPARYDHFLWAISDLFDLLDEAADERAKSGEV